MSESTELKVLLQCQHYECTKVCAFCGADRKGYGAQLYACAACAKRFHEVCCVCKKQKTNSPAKVCSKCANKHKPKTCYFCGCKGKEVPGRWV